MTNNLQKIFEPYREITRFNEPLAKHTSFGVGGPAEVFITPHEIDQIKGVYLLCQRHKIPVFILGGGTNLLVRDEGIKGVVIKPKLTEFSISGSNIEVGAGYALSHLVTKCIEAGLGGLESLAGIPGTVGGAVAMNAGGKYGTMSSYVTSIMGLNRFGEEKMIDKQYITFGYRTSSLKGTTIILEVNLRLTKSDTAGLKARFQEVLKEKAHAQPLATKNAGCIFKNPEGKFAGDLIDRAGLKGYTIGGAQVSDRHGNFIVNTGNATARDIQALMAHISETVRTKFGVVLEPEIEVWP